MTPCSQTRLHTRQVDTNTTRVLYVDVLSRWAAVVKDVLLVRACKFDFNVKSG